MTDTSSNIDATTNITTDNVNDATTTTNDNDKRRRTILIQQQVSYVLQQFHNDNETIICPFNEIELYHLISIYYDQLYDDCTNENNDNNIFTSTNHDPIQYNTTTTTTMMMNTIHSKSDDNHCSRSSSSSMMMNDNICLYDDNDITITITNIIPEVYHIIQCGIYHILDHQKKKKDDDDNNNDTIQIRNTNESTIPLLLSYIQVCCILCKRCTNTNHWNTTFHFETKNERNYYHMNQNDQTFILEIVFQAICIHHTKTNYTTTIMNNEHDDDNENIVSSTTSTTTNTTTISIEDMISILYRFCDIWYHIQNNQVYNNNDDNDEDQNTMKTTETTTTILIEQPPFNNNNHNNYHNNHKPTIISDVVSSNHRCIVPTIFHDYCISSMIQSRVQQQHKMNFSSYDHYCTNNCTVNGTTTTTDNSSSKNNNNTTTTMIEMKEYMIWVQQYMPMIPYIVSDVLSFILLLTSSSSLSNTTSDRTQLLPYSIPYMTCHDRDTKNNNTNNTTVMKRTPSFMMPQLEKNGISLTDIPLYIIPIQLSMIGLGGLYQPIYQSSYHGLSFSILYQKLIQQYYPNTIIIIEAIIDDIVNIFGYYTTIPWQSTSSWYGTTTNNDDDHDESFLFRLYPNFNIYPLQQQQQPITGTTTSVLPTLPMKKKYHQYLNPQTKSNYNHSNNNLSGLAVGGIAPNIPRLHITTSLENCKACYDDITFVHGPLLSDENMIHTSYFDIYSLEVWTIDRYPMIRKDETTNHTTTMNTTNMNERRKYEYEIRRDVQECVQQRLAKVDKKQFVDDFITGSYMNTLYNHRTQTRGRADFVTSNDHERYGYYIDGKQPSTKNLQPSSFNVKK